MKDDYDIPRKAVKGTSNEKRNHKRTKCLADDIGREERIKQIKARIRQEMKKKSR